MTFTFTCTNCGIQYQEPLHYPANIDGLCPPCYDCQEEQIARQLAEYENWIAEEEERAYWESVEYEEMRETNR